MLAGSICFKKGSKTSRNKRKNSSSSSAIIARTPLLKPGCHWDEFQINPAWIDIARTHLRLSF